MVDASAGVLGIEWIEGVCVRRVLPGGADDGTEPLSDFRISQGEASFLPTCANANDTRRCVDGYDRTGNLKDA